MSEIKETRPLAPQRCEPEAEHGITPEYACLLSIATSLKRIADTLDCIADRMPSHV
jgi:hypothetical protein